MPDERITNIIQMLEQIRERPAMFAGANTCSAINTFLSGFETACFALGLPLPNELRQQAKEMLGWPRSAEVWSITEMKERGLSDHAIAEEMGTIDITAWRLLAELSEKA